MSGRMASFWLRAGEALLAGLALLTPLAFLLHSYDAGSLKTTLLQAGALGLLACWLLKGLERGRWEMPAQALPLALPAVLLAVWTAARFAACPTPLAALPGFLRQLLYLGLYAVALLEFGGARSASRFRAWTLTAGWAAGLYGLLQRLGVDPLPWKGAFGVLSFSTLGGPQAHGLFMAVCLPLTLSRLVDPERDRWARGADAALIIVLGLNIAASGSSDALLAFTAAGVLCALTLPLFLPSHFSLKAGAAALAATAGVLALSLGAQHAALAADASRQSALRRGLWSSASAAIAQRPVTGHGPGTMALLLESNRSLAWISAAGHDSRPEHVPGLLVEQTAELGLAGAGLWLWLFGAVTLAAWRAQRRFIQRAALAESAHLAGLFSATATLLLAGQWSPAAHETAPGWLLWPLAGLTAGLTLLAGRGPVSVLPLPLTDFGRRRLSAVSLAAAAALLAFPARWQLSDIRLNAAADAAKRGAYGEAARLAQQAVAGSQRYLEAQALSGSALLAAGRPEEALRAYALLETLDPNFVQMHYLKGQAFAKLGSWELAEASFERSRQLDPLFVPNLERLAVAAKEAGHYERARKAALAAVSLEPKDPVHWLALADIYRRERNLAEAKRSQERAAKLKRAAPAATGRRRDG